MFISKIRLASLTWLLTNHMSETIEWEFIIPREFFCLMINFSNTKTIIEVRIPAHKTTNGKEQLLSWTGSAIVGFPQERFFCWSNISIWSIEYFLYMPPSSIFRYLEKESLLPMEHIDRYWMLIFYRKIRQQGPS